MKLGTTLLLLFAMLVVALARTSCDKSYSCWGSQTCCKKSSGNWGCCPFSNGECCNDVKCCPSNKTCVKDSSGNVSCQEKSGKASYAHVLQEVFVEPPEL